jgi:phosphoglycolate phosphatase-like HAD superfamily hydrolase
MNILIEKIKTIFWDFDGVIMDSMSVRDKGFEIVLKNYPQEQVALLMAYHRDNGGLSRYHKFRYFFEEIRGEIISDLDIKILADEFSIVMLGNLLDESLLIKDSFDFIKKNYSKFNMHIVSGSDEVELRHICETLGLANYFISIHGSPTPKVELVKRIMSQKQYKKEESCLIGDSFNDLEAAEYNSILFIGYNNQKIKDKTNKYINSFFKIL